MRRNINWTQEGAVWTKVGVVVAVLSLLAGAWYYFHPTATINQDGGGNNIVQQGDGKIEINVPAEKSIPKSTR